MKVFYKDMGNYSEISQINPLRWVILKMQEDGNFVNHSSWWKCKDFLNDWVAVRECKGQMMVYGFKATDHDNTKPLYMGLRYITSHFFDNLKVLNTFLPHPIGVFEHTEWENGDTWKESPVIEVPLYYVKNTYRISLVTLLIRLCNIDKSFKNWNDMVNYKYNSQDQNLLNKAITSNLWFKPHLKIDKYVWYCGEIYNNENKPNTSDYSSCIHNNGLVNWATHLGNLNAM